MPWLRGFALVRRPRCWSSASALPAPACAPRWPRSMATRLALGLLLASQASLTGCCRPPQLTGPLAVSTRADSVRLLPSSDYQVSQAWMRHVVLTVATLQQDNERLRERLRGCR